MCRENSYSVAVAVVVTCPVVCRRAVVHEVTVTWMNSTNIRSVIRTYMYWLRWLAVRSHISTLRLSVTWTVSWTSHCSRLVVSVARLEVRLGIRPCIRLGWFLRRWSGNSCRSCRPGGLRRRLCRLGHCRAGLTSCSIAWFSVCRCAHCWS